MDTDEWYEFLDKLAEAWQQFTNTVQEMAEALGRIFNTVNEEEQKNSKTSNHYEKCFSKRDYLRNQTPAYKIERRPLKHLPYQRRNY